MQNFQPFLMLKSNKGLYKYKYIFVLLLGYPNQIVSLKDYHLARIVVPGSARWFACSLGCTLSCVGWGRLVAIVGSIS